ncbi:MAG: tetratricopeptide repeat protein [Cytophagales bacterium]|nr:tetratricopeptide repeat protein [Cytophagales bacterium]
MRYLVVIICLFITTGLVAQRKNSPAQIEQNVQLGNEYYVNGELEKAEALYKDLAKQRQAIPGIHTNYFSLLVNQQRFKEADKYLTTALKYYPTNYQYRVDQIFLYASTGEEQKQKAAFQALKKQLETNQYQLTFLAQSFVTKELFSYAIDFLHQARKINGRPAAYALDLATVYRMTDQKQLMVEEYLYYALANPSNLNYIKNIFQNLFADEEDLAFLEETLIRKIQKEPEVSVYSELLIWIELQRKNFYGAFLQARALDRRTGSAGDESIKIGRIAIDNKAWQDAVTIYEYVVKTFGKSYNYGKARRMLIVSKEGLVKSTFPVDKVAIRALTIEYQRLYDELGASKITMEGMRSKALLHAFHLSEMQIAIDILEDIIAIPRVSPILISRSKLDLGDIYLLQGDPWEASLLYSQVEKLNKETLVGYEAKLRNAKLNYYTGYFALALSHIDILKRATTREISNDAISLSLLINNNTILDTSDFVMKKFADTELLLFQNKNEEAIASFKELIDQNPGHSIVDESYWSLAKIYRELGQFDQSVEYLEKLLQEYGYDILADDAAFAKAEILERNMGKTEDAQELYRTFLTEYPGSMYAAEARKRFRQLRGDILN